MPALSTAPSGVTGTPSEETSSDTGPELVIVEFDLWHTGPGRTLTPTTACWCVVDPAGPGACGEHR